jgi:hypothetical protein
MTMKRFPISPPMRRQLLRESLMWGASLAVVPVGRVAAASASAARQEVKLEEENQLMPEIMHLIKIRAGQDKVYQTVATAKAFAIGGHATLLLPPTSAGRASSVSTATGLSSRSGSPN